MDTTAKGIKTSEFWLTLLAMILGALLSSGVLADGGTAAQIVGAVVAGLSALGYTAGRSRVKADAALGAVADLGGLPADEGSDG